MRDFSQPALPPPEQTADAPRQLAPGTLRPKLQSRDRQLDPSHDRRFAVERHNRWFITAQRQQGIFQENAAGITMPVCWTVGLLSLDSCAVALVKLVENALYIFQRTGALRILHR